MEAVRITIEGQFYDSQIYSGRLYLWTFDSQILVIDWDRLIEDLNPDPDLEIAMQCAFGNSDYLVGDAWRVFASDRDIRNIILEKLSKLAKLPIRVNNLQKYVTQIARNYFPFPHAAVDIFHSNLVVGGRSGLRFSRALNREIERPQMLVDIPTIGISPKNFLISLACGEEGVYEINPRNKAQSLDDMRHLDYKLSSSRQVMKLQSNNVHWMYNSIFASGNDGKAGIAKYAAPPSKRAKQEEKIKFFSEPPIIETKIFDEKDLIADSTIERFYSNNQKKIEDDVISWGIEDKICAVSSGTLSTYFYRPFLQGEAQREYISSFELNRNMGEVVNGSSASFGYIIEMDEGLQIILSDSSTETIIGEPVNWRVFNRSKNYANQLHIIYDDRIEIVSYNESAPMETYMKKIGISYNLETAKSKMHSKR